MAAMSKRIAGCGILALFLTAAVARALERRQFEDSALGVGKVGAWVDVRKCPVLPGNVRFLRIFLRVLGGRLRGETGVGMGHIESR
jgi:hypothetical protein